MREERESSKIEKMSGMSPPRTHVLGTEPHGRNHETWLENRMSIVWETDIFVVISSVDGRTRRTRQFWPAARTIFHKERRRKERAATHKGRPQNLRDF